MEKENKSNTLWLARLFQYLYEVIVAADRPIFMAAMVVLPFIAPLLPAMITGTNLQKFLFPDHPNWVWIGIVAFELVAMLSQVAVVSARMNLVEDPNNIVLQAESRRAGWSYTIYILTLIAANVFLELANGVSVVNVFVVACLTVGLSFSSSLVNASRIHKRDQHDQLLENARMEQERQDLLRREAQAREDRIRQEENERQDKIRVEKEKLKLERWRLKHGYASTVSSVSPQFPNDFDTKEKQGRPSIWETPVFDFMDNHYRNTGQTATFNEVLDGIPEISRGSASKNRNKWISSQRWLELDKEDKNA